MICGFWLFLRTAVGSRVGSYTGPLALIHGCPTHPVTVHHIYSTYPLAPTSPHPCRHCTLAHAHLQYPMYTFLPYGGLLPI